MGYHKKRFMCRNNQYCMDCKHRIHQDKCEMSPIQRFNYMFGAYEPDYEHCGDVWGCDECKFERKAVS